MNYNPVSDTTHYRYVKNGNYEKSFWGFDIEIGSHIPQYSALKFYSAYYLFSAKNYGAIHGLRLRSVYDISYYLGLEGSIDLCQKNNYAKYIGIRLTLPFAKPKQSASYLEKQMIALPTRDIDVVSDSKSNSIVKKRNIKGKWAGVVARSEKKENNQERFLGNSIITNENSEITYNTSIAYIDKTGELCFIQTKKRY